ncbi:MAG TPA: PAS domain S-box protein [Acidimicrobiales bacterium]|nr:PAS domain S-box protein [Acidimicrobiales bacterium]
MERRGFKLRTQLTAVIGVVLLFGAWAIWSFDQRVAGSARHTAVNDARAIGRVVAVDIERSVEDITDAVTSTALTPGIDVLLGGDQACNLNFNGQRPFASGHLDLLRADGTVACSSQPSERVASYGAEPWWHALGDHATNDVARDPNTGRSALIVAMAIPTGGAVAAFMDVESLARGLAASYRPTHLEFLIKARDGDQTVSRSATHGGARRTSAAASVADPPWLVVVDATHHQAITAARQHARLAIGLGSLVLALVAVGGVVLHRRLARPIEQLRETVLAAIGSDAPIAAAGSGATEVKELRVAFADLVATNRRDLDALRSSEARAMAMLRSTIDCVITIDGGGVVEEFNPAAERTFGYQRADVVGRPLAELIIPPGQRAAHLAGLARFAATGEGPILGQRIEVEAQRADGTAFPAELTVTPVEVGGRTRFTGILRDITDQLRVEAERRTLEYRVQQSERLESLGQLAGGVAHDFNNLLSVILNYATFALEQSDDERVRADITEIRAAAERAARLTRQLLIFGRRDTVLPEVLDLNAVVTDVHELLSRSIGAQVRLELKLADELPPLLIDRGQLEQVLLNVAVNARDAMPHGGTLTIATAADLDAAAIVLSIADTGTGMTVEVQAQAFEPFFTTKPKGEGSGLGLATVYSVVAQAGGDIAIDTSSSGTTFLISFPIATAAPDPHAAPTEEAPAPTVGGRVLVVDDEPGVRDVVSRILRRCGFEVVDASGGPEALTLSDTPFDILLTDVVMPGLSGPDLASRLRERWPNLRVVYMSGYSDGVFSDGDLDSEIRLLPKPFTEHDLLVAIRDDTT